MYYYKAFGLNISSEIELPELSSGRSEQAFDLLIQRGPIVLPKQKKTSIYRRGIRASFGSDDQNRLFLHWEGVANFRASNASVLTVDSLTTDSDLLSLFTVSEAFGMILFQKGLFLLHASSIRIGDEAWCFMGSPGAGKSTTAAAFIKAGCTMLSDDLTAIKFDEFGKAYVIPAYPQLKIWDNTVNGLNYDRSNLTPVSEGVNKFSFQPKVGFGHEPIPLKEVFFIHKAMNRVRLEELSAAKTPMEMLKNFPLPLPLLNGEALKRHFVQSYHCSNSARIWKKRRPDGFQNLEKWVNECVQLKAGVFNE